MDFQTEWDLKYNAKNYDFSDPDEKEKFLVAVEKISRYLAHTARSATIHAVKEPDGSISTFFVRIT